jgi:tRNA-methyltransferase O
MATSTSSSSSTSSNPTNVKKKTQKSKIRPPRGNGIKVGQLATRSPHRPNPIGLSLVNVVRYDNVSKRLYISGMDIVNGTPVYDIKPVVPWDIPGYSIRTSSTNDTTAATTTTTDDDAPICHTATASTLRVPDWVSCTEDIIDTVTFTIVAQKQLRHCITEHHLAPLYTNENDGMIGATQTIQQILAQDPRSSHKGLKSNARGTKKSISVVAAILEENAPDTITSLAACQYSLVLCNVKISFTVTESNGCQVVEIIPIVFDSHQYVDGIPLIMTGKVY